MVSLVTSLALEELAPFWEPGEDGTWTMTVDGIRQPPVTDEEFRSDIARWVRGLEGKDEGGGHLASLVRAPGWGVIIARRVIRDLREMKAIPNARAEGTLEDDSERRRP